MTEKKARVALRTLSTFIDKTLEIDRIPNDYSNNGIQVEGSPFVTKAVFGVDACDELFQAAVKRKAEFILVHHGLSWHDKFKRLDGLLADRLKVLFQNEISLYGVHLPLDAHKKYGHNACLADIVKLKDREMFITYCDTAIGIKGTLTKPVTLKELGKIFDKSIKSEHVLYGAPDAKIKKLGIVSGGSSSDDIEEAAANGLDCFVTGEVTHSSYHIIKETGINVISLGHYRSEQPGVWAMMDLIKNKFGIECEFIEIPTGM